MDPLSHSLSGFVSGSFLTKNRALLFVFIISTLSPDLDIILRLHGKETFLIYHRGITHGILALFVFPLIPALILRKKYGFFKVYLISLCGYALHILLDLTNQYGTRILCPFDCTPYSLSLTFIIDPYVLLPFLLSVIISLKFKKQSRFFYLLAIIFVLFYIGLKAYLKTEARDFLKQKIEAQQYRVYPLPNDFLRWWFVSKYNDEYITGFVDLFSKKVYIDKRYKIINDDAISKSKDSQSVKALLNIAKHPVAEAKREGNITVVTWRELSYGFLPEGRFSAQVWLKEASEGYKIINSKLTI
ncbi:MULTISPECIES: metal-dependent hydrolase [Thermodesulfovibrio]|jgi:inner membrane protein|uniref:metal-dependent hydrolase n=1 Tax=Thermodesulfovibrio TaxID=28261 RepID=UPI0026345E9D|nr:metal-dependent hydrolase [Thermodesulfovibrio sp.]